jgi:hypothetical protein
VVHPVQVERPSHIASIAPAASARHAGQRVRLDVNGIDSPIDRACWQGYTWQNGPDQPRQARHLIDRLEPLAQPTTTTSISSVTRTCLPAYWAGPHLSAGACGQGHRGARAAGVTAVPPGAVFTVRTYAATSPPRPRISAQIRSPQAANREVRALGGCSRPKRGPSRVLHPPVRSQGAGSCSEPGLVGKIRGLIVHGVRQARRAVAASPVGAVLRGSSASTGVIDRAGRAMTVKLQVRLLVRTLSVSVRGVSRFASLRARTYSGQGRLFT